MSCLSLMFWRDVFIDVIVIVAVIMLLRVLIAALGGGAQALWPPVTPISAAPGPGLLGVLVAAINIIIWAIIMIAIVLFIFMLLGCLVGAAWHIPFHY